VLIGIIQRTVLAHVWRRNTSQKETTYRTNTFVIKTAFSFHRNHINMCLDLTLHVSMTSVCNTVVFSYRLKVSNWRRHTRFHLINKKTITNIMSEEESKS
jgi:hypothetical protein